MGTYIIIFLLLLGLELGYFKVADRFNIIDKPNERSSHSTIVLRGGGIIFTLAMVVWYLWFGWGCASTGSATALGIDSATVSGIDAANVLGTDSATVLGTVSGIVSGSVSGIAMAYLPFMCGLVLIAGVSFWDDVQSLPDSVRLVAQFVAIALMFWSMGIMHWELWWVVLIALIVCVGTTNIINFMDGINGITAAYALAVLVPLLILDVRSSMENVARFIEPSYLIVAIIGVLVFCLFNFRPKGKAKCFAGDVGSIGMAFIMLFAIGKLIVQTVDVTYVIFIMIYAVDGCFTIFHRIMLHENLGQAHRKHAFQLMANELKMGHITVSLIYMGLQLAVSLGFIYLCPNDVVAHWIYLVVAALVFAGIYILFMKKYYHLHEAYLQSLK